MVYSIRVGHAVTTLYMEIIEKAFELTGQPVSAIRSLSEIGGADDIYLAATIQDAIKLWFRGKRNIVIWIQGLWSEESFMRHQSYLRKAVIDAAERFILKRARFVFFVSRTMRLFYEGKYGLDFSSKSYIMPCFNSEIEKKHFYFPGKYENNTFAYIGGLQVWQRFDDIVSLYKILESSGLAYTKLIVYTQQQDEARTVLQAHDIKNYKIGCVKPEEVQAALAEAKFGFVIREDIDVNRVATPTKISNYLASGVIPIYSSCLYGVSDILSQTKYALPVRDTCDITPIVKMMETRCQPDDIYQEYSLIFAKAYNTAEYIRDIKDAVKAAGF